MKQQLQDYKYSIWLQENLLPPLHAPGETQNGATGREWRDIKPPKGRHWRSNPKALEQMDNDGLIEWSSNGVPRKKIYADEKNGKKKQDIWKYKDSQNPSYPTEKNIEMIKTIILASSNPHDLVLDCFCGSGVTLQAAQELKRKWIGIDESYEAIKVTKNRLSGIERDLFGEDRKYNIFKPAVLVQFQNGGDIVQITNSVQVKKLLFFI